MAASLVNVDSLRLLVVGRWLLAASSYDFVPALDSCLLNHRQIFDTITTLDLEVEFIWKSEMNIMKGMYFVNRYSAILEFLLTCLRLLRVEGVIYILGIYIAEYVFAKRTSVIWGKSKMVLIPLCLYYIGTFIYNFISYYPILNNARSDLPSSDLWIAMLLLVAYDAAMIILISLAAINMWRRSGRFHSHLFRVLYGEGVLFYLYLLAFSIMSLVASKVSNPFLFLFMGRCLRSILASRVILHIRQS
ncbi:hypothetical protein AGABI1DRAFT_107654, partial [Agaricus bisporus var. burnettii JB137-S8]